MKINEIVVFYIDKDEKEAGFPKIDWPTVDPKYSTLKNISKRYTPSSQLRPLPPLSVPDLPPSRY